MRMSNTYKSYIIAVMCIT
ncbi:DUF1270 family protein, partial [Staphylococcus aureus]|nr:DUF1270 family protein [Staphylococcus aureus]